MDSKVCAADGPAPRTNRWMAYMRSVASRVLKSTQRSPFDEVLKLNSLFTANSAKRDASLPDSVEHMTKAS
jgi:hypothetical protein